MQVEMDANQSSFGKPQDAGKLAQFLNEILGFH